MNNKGRSLFGVVYPTDLNGSFPASSHYVFYNTLFRKLEPGPTILDLAYQYFGQHIVMQQVQHEYHTINNSTSTMNIDNVLIYLDKIIASEYSKETAYLAWLASKKNVSLEIPTLEEDWTSFVHEIQTMVGAATEKLDNLKIERQRLSKNKAHNEEILEKYDNPEDLQRAACNYTRQAQMTTSQQLYKVINFLSGENKQSRTGATVLNYIVKHYGASLLKYEKNDLVLNREQVQAAIIGISHILLDRYNQYLLSLKLSGDQAKIYRITNDFEEILSQDAQLDIDIENMINSLDFKYTTSNWAQAYNVKKSNSKRIRQKMKEDINLITQQTKYDEQADIIIKDLCGELQRMFSGSVNTDTINIIKNKNILSEIRETLMGAMSGAFHGARVGDVNAKVDEILAYVTINPNAITDSELLKQYNRKIKTLINELENVENSLKSTNTAKYYQQSSEKWDNAMAAMERTMQELSELIGDFSSCYVIEDTTKSYESLFVKKYDKNKHDWTSFSAGEQGNIAEFIGKINTLSSIGGIGIGDTDWLINACINAGPGMVNQKNKSNLENYFAAIAAMLMFDNQIGIVKDAFLNDMPSSTTHVKQIHLFSINNGLYPLSYILRLTKTYLTTVYQKALEEIESEDHGMQVELSGFQQHPTYEDRPITPEKWKKWSANALQQLKIQITFLGGFLDLLDAFFPKINN